MNILPVKIENSAYEVASYLQRGRLPRDLCRPAIALALVSQDHRVAVERGPNGKTTFPVGEELPVSFPLHEGQQSVGRAIASLLTPLLERLQVREKEDLLAVRVRGLLRRGARGAALEGDPMFGHGLHAGVTDETPRRLLVLEPFVVELAKTAGEHPLPEGMRWMDYVSASVAMSGPQRGLQETPAAAAHLKMFDRVALQLTD